jgi:hypothetical protein
MLLKGPQHSHGVDPGLFLVNYSGLFLVNYSGLCLVNYSGLFLVNYKSATPSHTGAVGGSADMRDRVRRTAWTAPVQEYLVSKEAPPPQHPTLQGYLAHKKLPPP